MELDNLVRENIKKLKPYTSARDSFLEGILLDANENPFGSVAETNVPELNRYPDPNQNEIREALGSYLNISKSKLFFGVGSDEIIDLLFRIFCIPAKDNVIAIDPSYGMYSVCADINDIEIRKIPLTDKYQINVVGILNSVDINTKMIFLCSPNNPTSNILNRKDICELCEKSDRIVIVDEAYIDFYEEGSVINEIENYKNLIILRTFSKAWGMAGIRCGYCAADEIIINYLLKVKAPYNINKLTRLAVLDALKNISKKDKFVNDIIDERERIIEKLKYFDKITEVFDSQANYVLFRIENSDNILKYLAEKGIIIRDRSTQTNLENCLRLSIGTKEENNLFLEELEKLL